MRLSGHPRSRSSLERCCWALDEKCIRIFDWESLDLLQAGVERCTWHHNNDRIHFRPRYLAPAEMQVPAIKSRSCLQRGV